MRILITGASGQLGSYLLRHFSQEREFHTVAWSGSQRGESFGIPIDAVDLQRRDQIATAFEQARPDAIIHSAAISRIDTCYAEPELAQRVNVDGTRWLVELARRHRARLVYVSTDLVFDGSQGHYRESDSAVPLSRYGRSKRDAEPFVQELAHGLVARVSLLFGPSLNGRSSFFEQQCAAVRDGRPLTLFADEWRTPLDLATAASALVQLALSDVAGLVHVGGPERLSRWEIGQRIAQVLGRDAALLKPGLQSDVTFPEPRPRDVSLDSSKWRTLFPHHPWPNFEKAMSELGVE